MIHFLHNKSRFNPQTGLSCIRPKEHYYYLNKNYMLTEDDIVDILAKYLEKKDYRVIQKLKTTEKGIDIILEKDGVRLCVEAKGGTSSKKNSRRYGLPFNKNQVGSHIGSAILVSMRELSKNDNYKKEVAIALPDNQDHRDLIEKVYPVLYKTGIKVFFVKKNSVSNF